ncbi:unnamed protein product [Toxocara canis]|uniref:Bactericidal permeability-increasing protein n=1 Tax=Toxocara canis TaxID=6265 RepID=A0A183UFG6_TOXCA|nr:unnamed protein product [Toxocara canis]
MFSVLVGALLSTLCAARSESSVALTAGRARAAAFSTNLRSPIQTGSTSAAFESRNNNAEAAGFNPALLGGVRGYPGITLRLNQRAFQYASMLVGGILSSEIKRARIPPLTQCLPQVNGCILVYNLYVSRYRCPQRVAVYPSPPNRIVISVQNLDVGVSGNLGGQIVVLLPLALGGIIHANAHQVSITVQAALERSPSGSPSVRIIGCSASIGYVDFHIENGGIIGDIVNNQFRAKVSEQVRAMIPSRLCEATPQIVSERINPKLAEIPQSIPLMDIASLAGGIIGGNKKVPEYCLSPQCQKPKELPSNAASLPSTSPTGAAPADAADENFNSGLATPPQASPLPSKEQGAAPYDRTFQLKKSGRVRRLFSTPLYSFQSVPAAHRLRLLRTRRMAPRAMALPFKRYHFSPLEVHPLQRRATLAAISIHRAKGVTTGLVASSGGNIGRDPCAGCPDPENKAPFSAVQDLLKALDVSKLSDILLTTQILRTHATPNDYTVELNGEFSPGGRGGTPFGPFPMYFPEQVGSSMADILISDFTLNSLTFEMHKRGFISFRVGPETPKVGDLLRTTCADDESDESFEDTEDEGDGTAEAVTTDAAVVPRRKRQDDEDEEEEGGGLADLGVCLGDIMPAVREAHPNKKLNILIRTVRAPSVIFSAKNGGTATLDLIADAEIHIDDTGEKVGTIRVTAVIEAAIKTMGNHIAGTAQMKVLKLVDKEGTLGLPQDALDNLANLGKDMISKMVNDALANGFTVDAPTSGLPVSFMRPHFRIVDHAILLSADLVVPKSLLGVEGGSGGCRRQK